MAEFVQTTLMDGYAGGPHITEAQLGLAHQATFGPDDYVLEGGRESEAQVLTNNSIRIFDAVYCIQGRRDAIPASGYTDVTINNGTQGMNRNDIIVRRYKKDEVSEEESTEYAVIKGTPSSGEAVDPSVTTGDIRSGAVLHEMKLYRVKLTGLNIVEVEPLFNILKNQATLQKEIAQSNKDLTERLAELNGNMNGIKYKRYTITKNFAKGTNDVIAIDIPWDKIVSIQGTLRYGANLHALPTSPVGGSGTYNEGMLAQLVITSSNMIQLWLTVAWTNTTLSVVIGYTD